MYFSATGKSGCGVGSFLVHRSLTSSIMLNFEWLSIKHFLEFSIH